MQGVGSGWIFQLLFYNNVLLQPKLTKPESLINIKWSWVCNNWFSPLCCLKVSWLLLLGLIMGGSGNGIWAYKWFCLTYWSSLTRHVHKRDRKMMWMCSWRNRRRSCRVTQLFCSSWEYRDQRSSALLNGLSGEGERDSEDRGMQIGIMGLLFLLTKQMWDMEVEPRGYNIKQLQCFPSFWGIVRHREW